MVEAVCDGSIDDVGISLPVAPILSTRGNSNCWVTTDFHVHGVHRGISALGDDHHLICVNLRGSAELRSTRRGPTHRSRLSPGSVIVVPAGVASGWDGSTAPSAHFRISPASLQRIADRLGSRSRAVDELRDVFHETDERLTRYATLLEREVAAPPHSAQSLIIQTLSDAIAIHIFHQYFRLDGAKLNETSFLAARTLRSVSQFVSDNLGFPIRLDQLAAVAGVSRFHFSRSFKASIGLSPTMFVERARVQRAIALMRDGSLALAEIAGLTGFSDQSHFTRRFRRQTGVSPAAYAREAGMDDLSAS